MPEVYTIAQIREWYPDPVTEDDSKSITDRACYCVGGALTLAHEHLLPRVQRFPDYAELQTSLTILNPLLSHDQAYDLAQRLIDANDRGHFDAAWEYAEAALTYRPAATASPEAVCGLP